MNVTEIKIDDSSKCIRTKEILFPAFEQKINKNVSQESDNDCNGMFLTSFSSEINVRNINNKDIFHLS